MTDTVDPGQYADAIATTTTLAKTGARYKRELDEARATIARVVALLDRTDGHGHHHVPVAAVQAVIDGSGS